MALEGWINEGLTYVKFNADVADLQVSYDDFYTQLSGDPSKIETFIQTSEQIISYIVEETWYQYPFDDRFKHRESLPAYITFNEVIETELGSPVFYYYGSVNVEYFEYNQRHYPPSNDYQPNVLTDAAELLYNNSLVVLNPEPEDPLEPTEYEYTRVLISEKFWFRGEDLNDSNFKVINYYDSNNIKELLIGTEEEDHLFRYFFDSIITNEESENYGMSNIFKIEELQGTGTSNVDFQIDSFYESSNHKTYIKSINGKGIDYTIEPAYMSWYDVSPSESTPQQQSYMAFGESHYPQNSFDDNGLPNDPISATTFYKDDGRVDSYHYYNYGTLNCIRNSEGKVIFPVET